MGYYNFTLAFYGKYFNVISSRYLLKENFLNIKLTRFSNSGTSKNYKPNFACRRGHVVIIICLRQFIRSVGYAWGSYRGFDQHLE